MENKTKYNKVSTIALSLALLGASYGWYNDYQNLNQSLEIIDKQFTTVEKQKHIINEQKTEIANLENIILKKDKKISKNKKVIKKQKQEILELKKSLENISEKLKQSKKKDNKEYSNIMTVTAYTAGYESTQKRKGEKGYGITASGATVQEGRTIACPKSIPFGTKIEIEGIGVRICEDRGGAIVEGKLDLYIANLSVARKFGVKKLGVRIIK